MSDPKPPLSYAHHGVEQWNTGELVRDIVYRHQTAAGLHYCAPFTSCAEPLAAIADTILSCRHKWSGPLDKAPTCITCGIAYRPHLAESDTPACPDCGPYASCPKHDGPSDTPADGLDVERLAVAVASAGVHVDVRDPLVRNVPCDSCARGVRVIAREYLALTQEPREEAE